MHFKVKSRCNHKFFFLHKMLRLFILLLIVAFVVAGRSNWRDCLTCQQSINPPSCWSEMCGGEPGIFAL